MHQTRHQTAFLSAEGGPWSDHAVSGGLECLTTCTVCGRQDWTPATRADDGTLHPIPGAFGPPGCDQEQCHPAPTAPAWRDTAPFHETIL